MNRAGAPQARRRHDAAGEGPTAVRLPGAADPRPGRGEPSRWDGSLFGRSISVGHRRAVFDQALAVLIPTLAPSLRRLDPVHRFGRMLEETLDWLDIFPGSSYQDRWQASGVDGVGGYQRETALFPIADRHNRFRAAVDALICIGVLRPSYDWLLAGQHIRLHQLWPVHHEPALFARLARAAAGLDSTQIVRRGATIDLVRLSIRTGRALAELSAPDLLDYRAAVLRIRAQNSGVSCQGTYHIARQVGLFDDGPDELGSLLTVTQRSPREIVDHYGVATPTMRTLLIDYLAERRPGIDYTTFASLAYQLCCLFWGDLERAHPGIDTHRLTREQTEAWKQRLATLPNGEPRRGVADVLLAVRGFYLDINHWAQDHPEQWARWAAPSPITRHEVRGANRNHRAQTARMHARVRDIAPRLPDLVRATRTTREHTAAVLAAARRAAPEAPFEVGDTRYTRLTATAADTAPREVIAADGAGRSFDAVFAEHEAFWSWAMIEVLRHTGIRIEELLELTHHSIRPYRQPSGEVIPLLQIAPSKTDAERVIPASPELAAALAQIVTRVAGPDGTIPLTSRRDEHERSWSDPQPHLFVHRLPPAVPARSPRPPCATTSPGRCAAPG